MNDNAAMLDNLAFNCSTLSGDLWAADSSKDKEKILMSYLQKVDKELGTIADFKDDLEWFNVSEPLPLKTLQGKIVVLDFFTYCCINCLHILPDLKRLEELYSVEKGVIIIGVHSAKFDNEKQSLNILSALQRHDITHPVVNDSQSVLWDDLGVQCWPTILILGPKGNPIFVVMGEGHFDMLSLYIKAALDFYGAKGKINTKSLPLNPKKGLLSASNLQFPGKIVCSKYDDNDPTPEFYAISDSGNHRILIMTSKGEVLYKIGGKESGFMDGDFQTTRFNYPQGLAFLNENILFVADTENHAIRQIDLKLGVVETITGIGKQGNDKVGGKIGTEQEISSPWDIVVYQTKDMDMSFHLDGESVPEKYVLIIAMAGTHQIWAYFIEDTIWWKYKKYNAGTCICIAGNGAEENRNNSYPQNAAFAQPSGLALNREQKDIYIADSESSCVRKMSLTDGKVSLVVGGDRNPLNLFAFGDADGKLHMAKLQHCVGVTYCANKKCAFVADTYNHKVKRIDIEANSISTWILTNKANTPHQFNEPGGLCLTPNGEMMYVTDTNNHNIELITLKSMKTTTLNLKFNVPTTKEFDYGKILKFDRLKVNLNGGKLRLAIAINLDQGVKLTEGAPQKFICKISHDDWIIFPTNGDYKTKKNVDLDITVPKKATTCFEFYNFLVNFKLNLCSGNVCFFKNFTLDFPVIYSKDGLDCIIEEVSVKVGQDVKI